jgi:hypothetical protein
MTPEDFEKLSPQAKEAAVAEHDENVRVYRTQCQICKYVKVGTLAEIRSFFRACDRLCKHERT